jgi:tRNA threonylcarbamoyladenosine biosynthesis protein TsaE
MNTSGGPEVKTRETLSRSPSETRALARETVRQIPGSAVIALHGELGSGKTCFVQGIAEALGIRRPVTSPTFTIINEYPGPRPLYHVDLYRLGSPDEALGIGLEGYLQGEGIVAIEWAERLGDLLPEGAIHVYFEVTADPGERCIRVEGILHE